MATDIRKVGIEINVTGNISDKFEGFSASLAAVGTAFDTLRNSMEAMDRLATTAGAEVAKFVDGVSQLTIPPKFSDFVASLSKLNGIKVPNLDKFTSGISALKGMGAPDAEHMAKIAAALRELSDIDIKVSGLADLAKGLKTLKGLDPADFSKFGPQLKQIAESLESFKKLKGIEVPNLKPLVEGLELMRRLGNVGATAAQVVSLANHLSGLRSISGIKLPDLRPLAEGLKLLNGQTVNKGSNLAKLVSMKDQLAQLDGIRLPDMTKLADGVKTLNSLKLTDKFSDNLDRLSTSLKKFKGPFDVPNLKPFADGIKVLSEINVTGGQAAAERLEQTAKALGAFDNVKVDSAFAKDIAAIANAFAVFDKVQTSKSKITELVSTLDALDNIKVDEEAARKLKEVADAFKVFDKIKVPNLAALSKSIKDFTSDIKINEAQVQQLDQIATALRTFSDATNGVKIPTLSSLVNGIKEFDEKVNIDKAKADRLTQIGDALKEFSKDVEGVKIPTLSSLVSGINNFSEKVVIDEEKAARLKKIGEALNTFSEQVEKVKIPNLNALRTSIEKFTTNIDLNPEQIERLGRIGTELVKFSNATDKVRIPNLNALTKSIKEFTSDIYINGDQIARLKQISSALQIFNTATNKIKIPNLKGLTDSIKGFNVSLSEEQVENLKGIADAFKIFDKIKIPNLKALNESVEAFRKLGTTPAFTQEQVKWLKDAADAMRHLSGIKVPAIGAMVSGMDKMMKLDVDSFAIKVEAIGKALNKLDEAGRLQSFKGFAEALNKVEKKLGNVGLVVDNHRAKIAKWSFAIASASSGLSIFNQRLYGVGRAVSAVNGSLASLTGFSALFGSFYALKNITNYLITFDDAIKKAGATAGATASQVLELERAARMIGEATRYTAEDAAMALKELTMAGLTVDESIGALPGVLQLAASAAIEISDAAHISTNVMRGYGMEVEDLTNRTKTLDDGIKVAASSINDVLVAAFTRSNTDLTSLGVAFRYAGPVAHSAGMQFEETASILASLAQAGYQGSQAGTTLRRSIANLLSPTKKMQDIMDDYGLSVKETNGNLRPMLDILDDMRKAGITTGDALEIFGKRAGAGMSALLQMSNIELRNMMVNMEDATGKSRRLAIEMESGIGGTWRKLISVWEELKLAIGVTIEDEVIDFFKLLTDTLRESKGAIVESIGTLLEMSTVIVGIISNLATFTAENAIAVTATLALTGALLTAKDVLVAYGKAALVAAAANKTAVAAQTASAVINEVTTWKNLTAGIAAARTALSGFLVTMGKFLMTPWGLAIAAVTLVVSELAYVMLTAKTANELLLESTERTIKESAKEAQKYKEASAALKLLANEYRDFAQAKEIAAAGGNTQVTGVAGDSRLSTTQKVEGRVDSVELTAYADAVQRAATVVPGATVEFNKMGQAILKVGGVAVETQEDIARLLDSMENRAAQSFAEGADAAMTRLKALNKEHDKIKREIEADKIAMKGSGFVYNIGVGVDRDLGLGLGDAGKNAAIAWYNKSIEENNKLLEENGEATIKATKDLEDFAFGFLSTGKTVDQFGQYLKDTKNHTKEEIDILLSFATSQEGVRRRLDKVYADSQKKFSEDSKEMRNSLQELNKELDEQIADFQRELQDGMKSFNQFKEAISSVVDVEFGDIDTDSAVRNAEDTLRAVNRVYATESTKKKELVIRAENEINKQRVAAAVAGGQRALAAADKLQNALYLLHKGYIEKELATIVDKDKKLIKKQERFEELGRQLAQSSAKSKLEITKRVASEVEKALEQSMNRELEIQRNLDSLLAKSREFSESLAAAMQDSMRDSMTPLGEYYDKFYEIQNLIKEAQSLTSQGTSGSYEKSLETLVKAKEVLESMPTSIEDDGVEVLSVLEGQAKYHEIINQLTAANAVNHEKLMESGEQELSSQKQIVDAYKEQADTLNASIQGLQEIVNQGLKVEIKIDLTDANEKLAGLEEKKELIIKTRLDVAGIQAEIDKIADEMTKVNADAYMKILEESGSAQSVANRIATSTAHKMEWEGIKKFLIENNAHLEEMAKFEQLVQDTIKKRAVISKQTYGAEVKYSSDAVNLKKAESKAQEEAAKKQEENNEEVIKSAKERQAAIDAVVSGTKKEVDATINAGNAAVSANQKVADSTNFAASTVNNLTSNLDGIVSSVEGVDQAQEGFYDNEQKRGVEAALWQQKLEDKRAQIVTERLAAEETLANKLVSDKEVFNRSMEGLEIKLQGKIKQIHAEGANQIREQEISLANDLEKLDKEHGDGVIDRIRELGERERDIREDLARDIKRIEKELVADLAKLDRGRAKDLEQVAQDILSYQESIADRIRGIDERIMDEHQINLRNKKLAEEKFAAAKAAIAEGIAQDDKAKLEHGQKLLEQSADLKENLEDQKEAKKGLLEIEKEMTALIPEMNRVATIDKEKELRIKAEEDIEKARISAENSVEDAKEALRRADRAADEKKVRDIESLHKENAAAIDKINRDVEDKILKYKEDNYAKEKKLISDIYAGIGEYEQAIHDARMQGLAAEEKVLKRMAAIRAGKDAPAAASKGSTADFAEAAKGTQETPIAAVDFKKGVEAVKKAQEATKEASADIKQKSVESAKAIEGQVQVFAKSVEDTQELANGGVHVVYENGRRVFTNMTNEMRNGIAAMGDAAKQAGDKVKEASVATAAGVAAPINQVTDAAGNLVTKLHEATGGHGTIKMNADEVLEAKTKMEDLKRVSLIQGTINIMTDPAKQALQDVEIAASSMRLQGTYSVDTTVTQEKMARLKEQVNAMFDQADTTDKHQRFQDMITVLNGLTESGKVSTETISAMAGVAGEFAAEIGDGIGVQIRVEGEKTYYDVIDGAGNKYEGLKEHIQSNPLNLFPEEYADEILTSISKIEGAAIQATSEREAKINFDKAKQSAEELKTTTDGIGKTGVDIPVDDQEVDSATTNIEELKRAAEIPQVDINVDTTDLVAAQETINVMNGLGIATTVTVDGRQLKKIEGNLDKVIAKGKSVKVSFTAGNLDQLVKAQAALEVIRNKAKEPIQISAVVQGTKDVQDFKKLVDSIIKKVVDIIAEVQGKKEADELYAAIDRLKNKTVTIVTNHVTVNRTVNESAGGGPVGHFAAGGSAHRFRRLSDSYITHGAPHNKEDDVPAMLQHGEFVQRRAAVRKYGLGFMRALNSGRIPAETLPKFNAGGLVSRVDSVVQKFASGGIVLNSTMGRMRKKLEETLGLKRSDVAGTMQMNLNNIVIGAKDGMSTVMGGNGVQALHSAFKDSIASFATGGTTVTESSVAKTARDLQIQYAKEIAAAKSMGNNELAKILQKEKEDLAKLALELTKTLKELEDNYKEFVKTTTDEHTARVAEIKNTFSENDTNLDTNFAEEVSDLKADYAERLASLAEDETANKEDFDEAIAAYKEDKDNLKKEYEEKSIASEMAYRKAHVDANVLGHQIGSISGLNKVIAEQRDRTHRDNMSSRGHGPGGAAPFGMGAHAGSLTLDELLERGKTMEGPYKLSGTSKPDFALMRSLIYNLWPELQKKGKTYGQKEDDLPTGPGTRVAVGAGKVTAARNKYRYPEEYNVENKMQNSVATYGYASSREEREAIQKYHGKLVSSSVQMQMATAGPEAGLQYLLNIQELENAIKENAPSTRRKEYEASLSKLNKEESEHRDEYAKASAAIIAERAKEQTDYNKSLTEMTTAYSKSKMEYKQTYDTDLLNENTSFKKTMEDAAAQYKQDVLDAKTSTSDKYKDIRDSAKEEYTSKAAELASSVADLDGTLKNELSKIDATKSSPVVASGKYATNPVISPLTTSSSMEEFLKRLGIKGFNTGGFINHITGSIPGKDSILASLTPGEFVIKEPIVRLLGRDFFENINAFRLPKFNLGGIVQKLGNSALTPALQRVVHELALSVNGQNVGTLTGSPNTIDSFISALSAAQLRA